MKRILIRITNHWTYPLTSVIVIVMLAFVLAANDINTIDIIILSVVVIAAFVVWRALQNDQTANMDNVQAVKNTISGGDRPTVVEFYSRYCVGCMAMKPIVDRLETEAGDQLRVIRLNIDEEPGKTLMEEYDVVFTPTFLFFDEEGNKKNESIGVLDRARILYEVEGLQ